MDLTSGDKMLWLLRNCRSMEYRDTDVSPFLWVSYKGTPVYCAVAKSGTTDVVKSLVDTLYERIIDKERELAHT